MPNRCRARYLFMQFTDSERALRRQDDPNSIGNKMKHFFEDTAKKARITATNVRSEAQASIIRMRDSMAKHKSKFVTFEEGEDIGILFADEVRCPFFFVIAC